MFVDLKKIYFNVRKFVEEKRKQIDFFCKFLRLLEIQLRVSKNFRPTPNNFNWFPQ